MVTRRAQPDLGDYLFTIAVIADTHLNEEETGSGSPYECNRVANARMRYVIQQLNQLEPAATIHLGDLVHPIPAMPSYAGAVRNFQELTRQLRGRLFVVPGNHDVGDKPSTWAPAGTVGDAHLALWTKHFGDHYYAFEIRGLRVVVINAQIINSGLAAEAEQERWLERELAGGAGRRTFLCLHYPPYLTHPDEAESYDNLAEPGRSWLLRLVETYRPEAMFSGHVHNCFFNRHAATECYVMPSTAFVRQDYSELHRVKPDDGEHGRNDLPKLGYALVKIYERGHVCHVVRTYGSRVDPGWTPTGAVERVVPLHVKENARAPLGVDLRHPWSEAVEIPPTGALDEFWRKRARNDYPLMALWEMGIRKLRVPFQDLEDPRIRERMRILRTLGHEFTVYTLDVPRGRSRDILVEHHDAVDAWEVVFSWPDVEQVLKAVGDVKERAPVAAYLSKLRSRGEGRRDGPRYYHFIDHGFPVAERGVIETLVKAGHGLSAIDGFVFRVARHASPWADIQVARTIAAELGTRSVVHIRMVSTNPAEPFTDDLVNANRIAESLLAAMVDCAEGRARVEVFIDSFADIDRGYFVRTGLVDRRDNPRLGGRVVRNLYAALNASAGVFSPGERCDLRFGSLCTVERPGELVALVMPERALRLDRVPAGRAVVGDAGTARWIDLGSGEVTRIPWRRVEKAFELGGGAVCALPTLISFPA